MAKLTEEVFERHRVVATQVEALYTEVDKLAKKRAGDSLTPLMAKKVNHVINAVRELVSGDDFLDAIETIPVSGNLVRMDEALIVLAELRAALDRQWRSAPFEALRSEFSWRHIGQIMQ